MLDDLYSANQYYEAVIHLLINYLITNYLILPSLKITLLKI